jgi:hypothetical protein
VVVVRSGRAVGSDVVMVFFVQVEEGCGGSQLCLDVFGGRCSVPVEWFWSLRGGIDRFE